MLKPHTDRIRLRRSAEFALVGGMKASMNSNSNEPPPIAPWWPALVELSAFIVLAWAFSWLVVNLAFQAEQSHPAPMLWQFEHAQELILKGTLDAQVNFSSQGLLVRPNSNNAHIMLRLPRAADTDVFASARITACAQTTGQISLSSASLGLGQQPLTEGCHIYRFAFAAGLVLQHLRIHLANQLGQSVHLQQAELIRKPPSGESTHLPGPPKSIAAIDVQQAQLSQGNSVFPLLSIDSLPLRLAPTLYWRDQIRAVRPEAQVDSTWINSLSSQITPFTVRIISASCWLVLMILIGFYVYLRGSKKTTLRGALIPWMSLFGAAALGLYFAFSWALTTIAAALFIFIIAINRNTILRGIRIPGSVRTWGIMLLVTLIFAILFISLAGIGIAEIGKIPLSQIAFYAAWALLQQLVLGPILTDHIAALHVGRPLLPIAAGISFGMLHLPNLELAIATAIVGMIWSESYLRGGGIWPQVFSHGALGTLASLAPPWYLHSMEAGMRYIW